MHPHPPLVTVDEARRLVTDAAVALEAEVVPLLQALGRSLAEDVHAAGDVPPFANSAMDGFAVAGLSPGAPALVVGESRAGMPATVALGPGEAVRISTGAVLPVGTEAVVPIERSQEAGGRVRISGPVPSGDNLRQAGEDLRAGELVLQRGWRLGPAQLALAVAAGRADLRCTRRPRVGILSSGDELREPGAPLGPGEIHNANAVALEALAREAGAQVPSAGRMGDSRSETEATLSDALNGVDVLVVSGGVSVGPHDHMKAALGAVGVVERFWRVSLRPGKPTWFGVRDSTLVFGLPGNPVSAIVTFLLFVRPALWALLGAHDAARPRVVTLSQTIERRRDRDEAVRVRLLESETGPMATPTGPQGSHQLSSMLDADALLLVRAGDGALTAGSRVRVEMIR